MSDKTVTQPALEQHWSRRLRGVAAMRPLGVANASGDSNKRWERRKPVAIGGYIYGAGLNEAVTCVVLDHSSSGARIRIENAEGRISVDDIPDAFRLTMMQGRERTGVDCRIVRRHADCVGVKFTSQFLTTVKPIRKLGAGAKR